MVQNAQVFCTAQAKAKWRKRMPPKVKVTKTMVANASFEVIRASGHENLNVRTNTAHLGCSTQPELYSLKTVDDIRREHKAQGWSDIGYHYLVYLDGTVHEGRDVDIAGAHASGHNTHSIGVCYVGGVENRPGVAYKDLKAKDTRTEKQKAALLTLLQDLRRLYPTARILGQCNVDKHGKLCPSFDARDEYRNI